MTIDTRARHAARSLQDSVATTRPMDMTAVARRHHRSVVVALAGVLAIAFASIALAASLPNTTAPDDLALVPDPNARLVLDEGPASDLPPIEEGIHQQNDSTSGPDAYTLFYGTAAPGTHILASSDYGSADTEVGESGQFYLRVEFEGAPTGVAFPILLHVGEDVFDYSFTWLWDPSAVEITALQKFGRSDDYEAHEQFFGTAPPGTVILASSPYGAADAVADERGEWHLNLWFEPPLPANEPFAIDLTVGDEAFQFEFVGLWELPLETAVHQEPTVSDNPHPYTRFFGTAPPGTHVLAASPYGSADLEVGPSGEFSLKLWFEPLPPAGENFAITLSLDGESYGEYHFTSWFEPAAIELTVNQYNTESESPEPFVKFFGTAAPGTHILATSEYGAEDLNVGESGEWTLQLFFSPLPPAGEEFPVTLQVNHETYGTYPFTSWFEPPTEVEITVDQHNTSSDSPEPSVLFTGTAPEGTQISLQSPFGTKTWNTENTAWEGRLWFSPLPPAGDMFLVSVYVDEDLFGTYPFTSFFSDEEPPATEVTVDQVNTESDSPEPNVLFVGTAPVGTQIQISSEFGTTTWNTENENWEGKLWFSPLPPAGEEFPVQVRVNGDLFGTYPFTSWYDPGSTPVTVNQYNTESDSPEPWVKFTGTAPPGTHILATSEYGAADLNVGESGEWALQLFFSTLPPAGQEFPVQVKVNGDLFGTYPFTSWWDPDAVEITAHTTNTTSDATPPQSVYYGTAPPGTAVTITSEYGGGSTTAGEAGGWEKQVLFEGAPVGVEFQVTVTVGEQVFHFGMTRLA